MKNSTLIKIPGLVDVHVHLREPGAIQKEDFDTGTKAAIAGGYTQILDMPNNIPSTDTEKQLENKIKLATKRIWCDLGFNFAGTKASVIYFNNIKNKVFGLKVYMNQTTGTLLVDNKNEGELIFASWKSSLPIMVHAEGDTVKEAISLAKKYKKKLHVCHVTADQLKFINKAKKDGTDISCEVCPHHLFLSEEDEKRLGPLGIMKPPLLSKKDREKLWENIDMIDMIATDHAPHTLEEKYDQKSPRFGVPGLETTLPLMFKAVNEKRITLKRFIAMACTNPKERFFLPDQENTYVLINPEKKYVISNNHLFTKCAWTPFIGLQAQGEIEEVVLRGKIVFRKGKFIGSPSGRIIKPLN